MARRLTLDTGVLIASERGCPSLIDAGFADDDLVVAAITIAELRTGVELADGLHRGARAEFLAGILEIMPVEPYDLAVAEVRGRLFAYVHRGGSRRGAHDLIIAATSVLGAGTTITIRLPGATWAATGAA